MFRKEQTITNVPSSFWSERIETMFQILFSVYLNLQQKIQTIPRACCITRSFSS